jgi:hypothetical protein
MRRLEVERPQFAKRNNFRISGIYVEDGTSATGDSGANRWRRGAHRAYAGGGAAILIGLMNYVALECHAAARNATLS